MVRKDETKTVLIIEDEAEVRNFASRVLELEGCRVLQAEDGDEGLRLVRRGGISLVLLDLKLPGDDGWAVLKQLKKEPEPPLIPVVVFTASVAELQRARALAMGAADYLAKPLSAASLRKSVARILRRKGTR
jgi:CheY-like chemotaxis protein